MLLNVADGLLRDGREEHLAPCRFRNALQGIIVKQTERDSLHMKSLPLFDM